MSSADFALIRRTGTGWLFAGPVASNIITAVLEQSNNFDIYNFVEHVIRTTK